jgi:hypothetical protein
MNRSVFESGVRTVTLANLRISGPLGEAPTGACNVLAGAADPALAIATQALAGRRIIRVNMARQTKEMTPMVLLSYRLRDSRGSGAAETFCATMLRPADEAAAA